MSPLKRRKLAVFCKTQIVSRSRVNATLNAVTVCLYSSLVRAIDLLDGQLSSLVNHCGPFHERLGDINLAGFISHEPTSTGFSFEITCFRLPL